MKSQNIRLDLIHFIVLKELCLGLIGPGAAAQSTGVLLSLVGVKQYESPFCALNRRMHSSWLQIKVTPTNLSDSWKVAGLINKVFLKLSLSLLDIHGAAFCP